MSGKTRGMALAIWVLTACLYIFVFSYGGLDLPGRLRYGETVPAVLGLMLLAVGTVCSTYGVWLLIQNGKSREAREAWKCIGSPQAQKDPLAGYAQVLEQMTEGSLSEEARDAAGQIERWKEMKRQYSELCAEIAGGSAITLASIEADASGLQERFEGTTYAILRLMEQVPQSNHSLSRKNKEALYMQTDGLRQKISRRLSENEEVLQALSQRISILTDKVTEFSSEADISPEDFERRIRSYQPGRRKEFTIE